MAKYKQVMQVSLCGNIKRGAFDAVTVNGGDVMEIIGKHLREEGIERGNCDTVCVINSAVNKLRQMWQHNGLGWVTDVLPIKVRGCTNVIVYYGSSTYDRAQMARLIDNIVQDCRAVGVETLPPDKLEALKDEWAR